MPRSCLLRFLFGFAASLPCVAQYPPSPVVVGFVTAVLSPTEIEVNGYRIKVGPKTVVSLRSLDRKVLLPMEQTKLFIRESTKVSGKLNGKARTVAATRLELTEYEPHDVNGSGVVDSVLPAPAANPSINRVVRVDGYPVLLTATTAKTFVPPLSPATPLGTNLWIAFRGFQREDGIVEADAATISLNTVSNGEDKLRSKGEYDTTAVDPDAHQNAVSKAFVGIDPKQIPPYQDTAMQSRVSDLGKRLIPKYQRDLLPSETSKIDFRFQVVDQPKWRDAYTLPNGIILIPREVVERMQNDTQLATVLADNIACALEKQTLRAQGMKYGLTGAEVAATAAGIFVPGLGLAGGIGGGIIAERLTERSHEQSGRVSLGLLRDAGFDIQQAPLAWWLLAAKKDKSLAETPINSRAAYLYKMLGTTWKP